MTPALLILFFQVAAWYPVEVEIRTDSDWTNVTFGETTVWVERYHVESDVDVPVTIDTGTLAIHKRPYDQTPVAVRADAWLWHAGGRLEVVVTKGDVGSATVRLVQDGRVVAAAASAGDRPGDPTNRRSAEFEVQGWRTDVGPSPVVRERRADPLVLAFYYPWYGRADGPAGRWFHWGPDERSYTDTPVLGLYDSNDPAVIRRHIAWARQAGIDGFIASWWGPGDFTDHALEALLAEADAADLRVTAYLEQAEDERAYADQIAYLRDRYGARPSWLRAGDRPVVFVYGRVIGQIGWDALEHARPADVFLCGDALDARATGAFDGLHTYNPVFEPPFDLARRYRSLAPVPAVLAATVVPGYDDRVVRTPGGVVPRRDGFTLATFGAAALLGSPDWLLVTSFDEWHEGSEIEPSAEHGEAYLDATARIAATFRSRR